MKSLHTTTLKALIGLLLLLPVIARADEVQIAVAANFSEPAKLIAADFELATGHKPLLILGSTGKLYAQIRNGAPFEVLLAADDETPTRLVKEGQAVAATQFTYAIGKLALWSASPGVVDPQGEILKRGPIEHLAIANPKLAPYGAAGVEVLKALGVFEKLEPKIVQAENISQAFQFVATGNATLGFVALSQLKAGEGSVWIVPPHLYTQIRQDAVLLERGKGKAAAEAWLVFLKSEKAKAHIKRFGYSL